MVRGSQNFKKIDFFAFSQSTILRKYSVTISSWSNEVSAKLKMPLSPNYVFKDGKFYI